MERLTRDTGIRVLVCVLLALFAVTCDGTSAEDGEPDGSGVDGITQDGADSDGSDPGEGDTGGGDDGGSAGDLDDQVISQTAILRSPFGIHAAGGQGQRIVELKIKSKRYIVGGQREWDVYLPDLTDPDDPRLDPANSWTLDGFDCPDEFDLIVTLKPGSLYWGNQGLNQALEQGLISGVGLTGYPSRPQVWLNLMAKLVERLDGDGVDDLPGCVRPVKTWQIENEFVWQWVGNPVSAQDAVDLRENPARWQERLESYVAFLQETAQVIRQSDPEARIVSGGFTGLGTLAFGHGRIPESVNDGMWLGGGGPKPGTCVQDPSGSPAATSTRSLEQVVNSPSFAATELAMELVTGQIAPLVDLVDFHCYKDDYRISIGVMEELNAMLSAAGYQKPLISLENAGPYYSYTIDKMASEIVKRYLSFAEDGGASLHWSSMNPTTAWNLNFQNLSLLDCSNQPKSPPYYAYRELATRMPEGSVLTRYGLNSAPTLWVYEIDPANGNPKVVFLWEPDDQVVRLTPGNLPTFAGESTIRVARISSTTSTGLVFEDRNASDSLDVGYEVLVLESP